MRSWLVHPIRVTCRLIWLAAALSLGAIRYFLCRASRSHAVRAEWLQQTCHHLLPLFRTVPRVVGDVPPNGLIVCNHVSYLDILVLCSLAPTVFVAKREVASWPVFGWFARMSGTIFVHRESRTHVGPVTDEIEAVLKQGLRVVLFPEGTSSDGSVVLPFKSSLLEPATRGGHALSVGHVQYAVKDGDAGLEACYWGDMTLAPHLVNLLSKRQVGVTVRFAPVPDASHDRKILAKQLHAEVVRLKDSAA